MVQQRCATISDLTDAVSAAPRTKHRAAMTLALLDVAQGSEALSEIDFVQLCRRYGLPVRTRQRIRRDSNGRRRYLDAVWELADGRTVVAEVDGALHMAQQQWWADQLRQNDITLSGALVLRFPSAVIRHEPELVVAQLKRAIYGGTTDMYARRGL